MDKRMNLSGPAPGLPSHAARLLAPGERVRYLSRPRWISLEMLLIMTTVVLALVVFSAIVEPGFIRLLFLPAIPLLGSFAASLSISPVILVTDRRVLFARRSREPLSIEFERLKGFRVRQNRLGRLIGFGGRLLLVVRPLRDLGEGVFLRFTLTNLRDAASLWSAISESAAPGVDEGR